MSDDARSTTTNDNPTDETAIDDTSNTSNTDEEGGGTELEVDDATLEEAKKSVEGLDDRYRPGARPTVALPGTNGTVAGTAFADMVDDNGELVDADDQDTADKTAGDETAGHETAGDRENADEKVVSAHDA